MAVSTPVEALRMGPEDLKAHLDAGEPVTIIDVRNPEAWRSSDVKLPGAIRPEAANVQGDPSWSKDEIIVAYCT